MPYGAITSGTPASGNGRCADVGAHELRRRTAPLAAHAAARPRQHLGRPIDADDADAFAGERHGDAAGAAAELEHRSARPPPSSAARTARRAGPACARSPSRRTARSRPSRASLLSAGPGSGLGARERASRRRRAAEACDPPSCPGHRSASIGLQGRERVNALDERARRCREVAGREVGRDSRIRRARSRRPRGRASVWPHLERVAKTAWVLERGVDADPQQRADAHWCFVRMCASTRGMPKPLVVDQRLAAAPERRGNSSSSTSSNQPR